MEITQTARSLIALRNWKETRNESGRNEYCADGLCLSLSEKPGGQDEAEAPSSTAKSRTITLCGHLTCRKQMLTRTTTPTGGKHRPPSPSKIRGKSEEKTKEV